ncbi:hypothetical protein D3C72_2245250 [compost metagenome]
MSEAEILCQIDQRQQQCDKSGRNCSRHGSDYLADACAVDSPQNRIFVIHSQSPAFLATPLLSIWQRWELI